MKKTILALAFTLVLVSYNSAQELSRGYHQGESFELSGSLPNGEDNTYTANNYIKLLPGFKSNPETEKSSLLQLGLNPFGIFPPDAGYTNDKNCVVGTIGGTVNVGAMGGLNYTIPIDVPVGINGMQPNISIGYNNQGGNGLLGWGWDLRAVSSITRTGQTLYHDGKMTGADLSNDDRFLLDGQRLILISGSYGTNGSEYKTENDCFSRICMTNSQCETGFETTSNTRFIVLDRTGNILEYDDKLYSPDGSKEILWMLSRITDRYGNAIEYHYKKNHDTGEIRLEDIEYTINESQGVEAQFQVKFNYISNRKDYELYYIGGSQLLYRDRLESIKVIQTNSQKTLSLYKFNYIDEIPEHHTDTYPNRIYYILSSIELKVYDEYGSFEKVNTTINWDGTSPSAVDMYQVSNSDILRDFPFMGDFNGDGYTDLALVPYKDPEEDNYGSPVSIQIYINNRNFGFIPASSMDLVVDKTLDWICVLDINDDGLDDIVPVFLDNRNKSNDSDNSEGKTTVRVYKNYGNCFGLKGEVTVDHKALVITGDFDGNGTNDVVVLEKKDHEMYINHVYGTQKIVYIDNIHWMGYKSSHFQKKQLNERQLKKRLGPVYDAVAFDYNNDGTSEVLLVGVDIENIDKHGSKLAKFDFSGSNDGITIIETYNNDGPIYRFHEEWCHIFPGDYNGDGMTDLLYHICGDWRIRFSDGTTSGHSTLINDHDNMGLPSIGTYSYYNLFPPSLSQMNDIPDNYKLMFSVADFDGDGCTDVCYSYGTNKRLFIASKFKIPFEQGWAVFRKSTELDISFNFRSQFTHFGNFLGRDNLSLLESLEPTDGSKSRNAYIISPASVNRYNSVASITDGMGNTTSFTYDYLMPKNSSDEERYYTFGFETPDQYGVRPIPLPVLALRTCKTQGINNSSVISKYYYSNAKHHKNGHGFMGFETTMTETYRNSTNSPWKTKKTIKNQHATLGEYAMMLPSREYNYINCNGNEQLVGKTTYEFDKVILSSNVSNLVICPALRKQEENTYSLDDGHELIKTVVTKYDYDYSSNNTYTNAYGCTKTTQTVTGYENGQGHCELEMQKTSKQSTFPITWIINRPDHETTTLTRNGESTATYKIFSYDSDNNYQANKETLWPNNGSQPFDRLTTSTQYGYDNFGNITDIITTAPFGTYNEQPRSVHYHYGSAYQRRLPTKEVHGDESDGYITTYTYDFHDRQKTATDCNGKTIQYETSPLSITQKTFPIDGTEHRTVTLWATNSPYKPEGASYYTWSKKTGGVTSMTFYHKTGLELRNVTFDFNGTPIFTDKKYNSFGLLEKESAPYRQGESEESIQWTSYDYDVRDRLQTVHYPDGTEKTMEYHGLKTISTTIPQEGNAQKTIATLNAMGWLKESVDAAETQSPTSVHYEYYSDGQLKWTQIGDDETTKIYLEYDHAGNRTLLHDPDYCTEKKDLTSIYNAFGEEVSTTTPRDLTTTYLYDQFGRMTHRTEEEPLPDGTVETKTTVWTYYEDTYSHHKGLLHTIDYPGQSITYSYDDFQRLRKEVAEFSDEESYTTRYSYDQASRKERVQFPSGYFVNYHYNDIGYFKSVTDIYGNEIYKTEKITPMGQTERFTLAGDMVCNREYHPEKHTLTHIHTAKGENILQNLRYDYDGFGNLAFRKDETRHLEEHFEYDHLNRLKMIKRGILTTGVMDYDPYGRMTKKVSDNVTIFSNAKYDLTSKPHAIDQAEAVPGVIPYEDQQVTYTCFDMVKRIEEGNNTLEYTYGYDRQRIFMEEHSNSVDRTKRYVGSCEFVTKTESNVTTESILTYLTSPTGIFAVVVTDAEGKHKLHYVLKDHLGSWTTITDADGTVEQELSFDAWGNRRDPENWINTDQLPEPIFDRGFTGHEHLYAFGLINMNGRVYDPLMSSFLSVDAFVQSPDNSQCFNRYAYCLNNPLKYTDPSGWQPIGGTNSGNSFNENWGQNYGEKIYTATEVHQMLWNMGISIGTWMAGNEMQESCSNSGDGGVRNEYSAPDDPPGSKTNNAQQLKERAKEAPTVVGVEATMVEKAAELTDFTLGIKEMDPIIKYSKLAGRLCVGVDFTNNMIKAAKGETPLSVAITKSAMSIVEYASFEIPFIGPVIGVGLIYLDVTGKFDSTLYNNSWLKENFTPMQSKYNYLPPYQQYY